ncbi:MAG: tetratricopeptide repeat protein [Planctomycetota bacterium]
MKRIAIVTCLALLVGCGPSKRTATIQITRMVEPKAPLSSQHMQIAVMNARMEGDTEEFDQKKWSEMTANMIQGRLEQAADQHKIPIKLVDRENMKQSMGEKDLAAAGVTDGSDQMAAAKVQGANAILSSKVTIKVDKQKGTGKTIDAMSAIGWARGGGGSVHTSDVEKESRNITVQCQFQLKDPGTNEVIVSHNGMPSQHFDKAKTPSPFFGGSKTEANMTPRDKVIAVMIEEQAQDFLCKIVPMKIDTSLQVQSGSTDASVAAVSAMVVDDFETALGHFKTAMSETPDDHESMFGAGVCCEKLKKIEDAKKYYRQAQSIKPKEENYNQAVARVSRM